MRQRIVQTLCGGIAAVGMCWVILHVQEGILKILFIVIAVKEYCYPADDSKYCGMISSLGL